MERPVTCSRKTFILFVVLAIAQVSLPVYASDFWTAKYLTSNHQQNLLVSPPAHDDSGNILAVWDTVDDTGGSQITIGRSADFGVNYEISAWRNDVSAGATEITPVIATDNDDTWLCIWSSNDPAPGAAGPDFDILYSRSTDAGVSWSAPQVLNSTAPGDAGFDTSPTLAMDSDGNCITAWVSDNDPDNPTITGSRTGIWISRSTDAGLSWTPAAPLEQAYGLSLSEPQIHSNGPASFGMIWTAKTNTGTEAKVRFAYTNDAGMTWSQPVDVNATKGSELPSFGLFKSVLTGDSGGRWMVSWIAKNDDPYGLLNATCIARSPDNGLTWLPILQVSAYEAITLYTDNSGTWCLGGQQDYYQPAELMVSRDFGNSWELAAQFPSTRTSYFPQEPEPNESAPFVWRRPDNIWMALFGKDPTFSYPHPRFQIRQATSSIPPALPENTHWTPAESFTESSLIYGSNPEIETDWSGNWITVYSTGSTDGDSEIGFVRSTDGGRNWSSPQILNSDSETESYNDSDPVIAASGGSVYLCVWRRDSEIWAARSEDYGDTWSAPAPVQLLGGGAVVGESPGISSLGLHQWVLAWSTGGAVYCSRSGNDGLSWAAPVLVQGGYTLNHCGHTTPCSTHDIRYPRIFSEPGNPNVFVGFSHVWTERPSGYTGFAYHYESTDGQLSRDGGKSFPDNEISGYLMGPAFRGTDEMANDGGSNWIAASRFKYRDAPSPKWELSFGYFNDQGELFTFEDAPVFEGRENIWGKVAMTHTSKWLRLWATSQYENMGKASTTILVSESGDEGKTWSSPTHLNTETPVGADNPVDLNVKGGISGNFVAVWEAKLPSGESTIWFSRQNRYEESGARDWQLFN